MALVLLCRDQGFQRHAVGNHQSGTNLLDETLFLEAGEKAAYRLAGSANHLPNLFVSESELHLAGMFGFGILIE
jgi:hypothetical protein